jgi:glycosyltransferase involved in cell wall biosynthesis
MKKGLVSIIVVSYNAEKYIEKTLLSCLKQTFKNIEVLLLDNASKDKTLEIVKKIQLSDGRLKIFENKENAGSYAGLNFLLEKAKGEYVAIQDHDDVWFPEKIEKQVKFLNKNQKVLACGTETFYYYEKRELLILDKREGFVSFVDHTSLVFRNNGFRYNTEYILADEYFEKKVLGGNNQIFCIGCPLAIHRIRDDGKNFSHYRFSFSRKGLAEFFEINGFNIKSITYFIGIFITKYFSDGFVWFIINIVKIRSKKISKKDFEKKYSNVNL